MIAFSYVVEGIFEKKRLTGRFPIRR